MNSEDCLVYVIAVRHNLVKEETWIEKLIITREETFIYSEFVPLNTSLHPDPDTPTLLVWDGKKFINFVESEKVVRFLSELKRHLY